MEDKLTILRESFEEEYTKYNHYIESDHNVAKTFVEQTINKLSVIPFENGCIELLQDDRFKISLHIPNNYHLFLTFNFKTAKYDDGIKLTNKYSIVTLFQNRELQYANIVSFKYFLKNYKKLIISP